MSYSLINNNMSLLFFPDNNLSCSFFSTTFVYVKFLAVWAMVLMADFLVEFRFEYLWPFWLLLRSVYDSFKYQGLVCVIWFGRRTLFLSSIQMMKGRKSQTNLFSISVSPFVSLTGLLHVLCIDCPDIRHGLFPLHPRSLVIFCSLNVRLGSVRLAHRSGNMFANSFLVASFCLHRSLRQTEGSEILVFFFRDSLFVPFSWPLQTLRCSLYWLSCRYFRIRSQVLSFISNETEKTEGSC